MDVMKVEEAAANLDKVWGGSSTGEIGERLTCEETEALARLFIAVELLDQADSLLEGHNDDCDNPPIHDKAGA